MFARLLKTLTLYLLAFSSLLAQSNFDDKLKQIEANAQVIRMRWAELLLMVDARMSGKINESDADLLAVYRQLRSALETEIFEIRALTIGDRTIASYMVHGSYDPLPEIEEPNEVAIQAKMKNDLSAEELANTERVKKLLIAITNLKDIEKHFWSDLEYLGWVPPTETRYLLSEKEGIPYLEELLSQKPLPDSIFNNRAASRREAINEIIRIMAARAHSPTVIQMLNALKTEAEGDTKPSDIFASLQEMREAKLLGDIEIMDTRDYRTRYSTRTPGSFIQIKPLRWMDSSFLISLDDFVARNPEGNINPRASLATLAGFDNPDQPLFLRHKIEPVLLKRAGMPLGAATGNFELNSNVDEVRTVSVTFATDFPSHGKSPLDSDIALKSFCAELGHLLAQKKASIEGSGAVQ